MATSNSTSETNNKVGILMVPYPAQSHLNMLFSLSHFISSSSNLPIHFASSTQHIRQLKLRNPQLTSSSDYSPMITFHEFHLPPCSNLSDLHLTLPHLNHPISLLLHEVSSLYPTRLIVIFDNLMASVIEDVKNVANAEAYTLRTISAFTIFFNSWNAIPQKDKPFALDPSDPHFPISGFLPGVKEASHPPDFLNFIIQQLILSNSIECGRFYNTSRIPQFEGPYVELLEKLLPTKKHFAVGPFASRTITSTTTSKHKCLEWLDGFKEEERESVIYICFGTTFSIPEEHIKELAMGLERSGQRFIWVLRAADKGSATNSDDNDDNQEDDDDPEKKLPEGFRERVGNRGMVLTNEWVPQAEILGHPSIGGFLSHCGWGSLTESLTMGVPVIACPVHSDQPLNSVLITKVLRVGFLIREDYWERKGEVVSSSLVESAVRRLMVTEEGEEMRRRAKEIGEALRGSVAEGGASRLDMESFIAHITRA